MKKETKMSLVNLCGEALYVLMGIVTAVGITNMTKGINDSINQKDNLKKQTAKKASTKRFWKK